MPVLKVPTCPFLRIRVVVVLLLISSSVIAQAPHDQYADDHAAIEKRKTPTNAVIRSLLIPGLGQHYKESHLKGWVFTLVAAGSSAFAFYNETARKSAVNMHNAARKDYLNAMTQDEMDTAYARMNAKHDEADDKRKLRDYGLYALAGVWVLGVVDAALGWPLSDMNVELNAAQLSDGAPAVAISLWR